MRDTTLMAAPAGAVLPSARGPWSRTAIDLITQPGASAPSIELPVDPLADDDFQLALYCCYELHYRGFDAAQADAEWNVDILRFRRELERGFLDALRAAARPFTPPTTNTRAALERLASQNGGPSLSSFVQARASMDQLTELCIHRSAYQLKEADPHTWAIPRLDGDAKAALLEIQRDEYGNGRTADMHAELFAQTMTALSLDSKYGAYLDCIPGITLATTNLISFFGLHRRWRGALIGHLALFEMTSIAPMARYSAAFDRLGLPRSARQFYDVHVDIDAYHHEVALGRMVPALMRDDPAASTDLVFGAAALTAVESLFARRLLDAWHAGRSSLLCVGAAEDQTHA